MQALGQYSMRVEQIERGFDSAHHCQPTSFAQPAHLPRDVPEKAEGFPYGALCRSLRAAIFCSVMTLIGRARLGKPSFFQTHPAAGECGWCVVSLLIS
jgi:hypothetical protein